MPVPERTQDRALMKQIMRSNTFSFIGSSFFSSNKNWAPIVKVKRSTTLYMPRNQRAWPLRFAPSMVPFAMEGNHCLVCSAPPSKVFYANSFVIYEMLS